jgi:hypothetical protein
MSREQDNKAVVGRWFDGFFWSGGQPAPTLLNDLHANGSSACCEPVFVLWGARCVDGPQGSRERPYPGEAKDVPFEPADAICLDVRLQIGAGIMPTSKPALT